MATNVQHIAYEEPTGQTFIQPIAPPSILGFYGFAGATLMVGAYLAGWYGTATTPEYLFPFAAVFGGLAQFMAAMWAFRARDGLAVGMHGLWGSFWIAYGILYLLVAVGVLAPPPPTSGALGFWFIVLAWITLMGAIAAVGSNGGIFMLLATLFAASAILASSFFTGIAGLRVAAGWVFVASAFFAWYTASAMMFENVFGRAILPVFKTRWEREKPEFALGTNEPGVKRGQ